jgi:RNA polymerase sigma factor (sigma-70 family)
MHDALDTQSLATPVAGESESGARRRLCLAAMAGAPGLLRYAARFAPSLEDAEDAYQRGMEVALTKGPICPLDEFIAWLHTVIRNEAISMSRRRGRETPAGDDIEGAVDAHATEAREPSAVAEWRERYRTLQDAMTTLSEAERVCLLLRSAGVSRAEIGVMTGFTDRKVERSIVRARKRLHAWHLDLAAGERCVRVKESLERVADHEADSRERKLVSRHVRHCGPCRATLRARRQTNAGIMTLVPVAVVGAGVAGLAVPDTSPAVDIVERSTTRLTVAGVPVVANTMRPDPTATTALVRTTAEAIPAVTTTGTTGTTGTAQDDVMAEIARLRAQQAAREAQDARNAAAARRRAAARQEAERRRRAAQQAGARAPQPAAAPPSQPASVQSTPAASPAAQPQLEFGP